MFLLNKTFDFKTFHMFPEVLSDTELYKW